MAIQLPAVAATYEGTKQTRRRSVQCKKGIVDQWHTSGVIGAYASALVSAAWSWGNRSRPLQSAATDVLDGAASHRTHTNYDAAVS